MPKVRASTLKPYEIAAWFASHDPLQELDQMQQALILAKFKLRPSLDKHTIKLTKHIITWIGATSSQLNSDVLKQVSSIIKANKQISKYDLIKEAEKVLVCKGTIKNCINRALFTLKQRGCIKTKIG